MTELRLLTAGESHGKNLVAILEGIPANLKISLEEIVLQLQRRRIGKGRGSRMHIERDMIEVVSGVRHGRTTGNPIGIIIGNAEWEKWKEIMSPFADACNNEEAILYPRPGHADLAGICKYNQTDIRNISERASARETAARVAAGALCRIFLKEFSIEIVSHIISIGNVSIGDRSVTFQQARAIKAFSPLRCVDQKVKAKMVKIITASAKKGDTLGGVFEIIVKGVSPGLGSHIQWDLRLDGALAGAIMALHGIKGVEIGRGFESARLQGSQVHDAIYYNKKRGYYRGTNNSGGIEGGMSNGEEIRIRVAMKPIPTVRHSLPSVNIATGKKGTATFQRSDVCAVNPASVIGEHIAAIILTQFFLRKFGGDSMQETKYNYNGYLKQYQYQP
ncbi:MAG: chorismate synthase [Candidatus Fischerbacteria bacterium RBG_13_37_8]|uniref:Chorismate synthase n=1 Tax=Candidatus Fischerbacteria bacterium RBG_13_37_8 TaxID=1817863 RepID=A0A1F5VKV3_9BACT|nr:MAG: chorismate synthase [Candidatus Fischerbacteria bacterium RBG_13_37_8]